MSASRAGVIAIFSYAVDLAPYSSAQQTNPSAPAYTLEGLKQKLSEKASPCDYAHLLDNLRSELNLKETNLEGNQTVAQAAEVNTPAVGSAGLEKKKPEPPKDCD